MLVFLFLYLGDNTVEDIFSRDVKTPEPVEAFELFCNDYRGKLMESRPSK
jgi:hypothetical protein